MKKLNITVLIIAAVISLIFANAYYVWAASPDTVVRADDFESYVTGQPLKTQGASKGWNDVFNGDDRGINIIEDEAEPGNQVLNFWTNGTGTKPWATLSAGTYENSHILLRFRFRRPSAGATGEIGIGSAGVYGLFMLTNTGQIQVRTENGSYNTLRGNCPADVFNNFAILVDSNTWNVKLYMNGEYLGEGVVADQGGSKPENASFNIRFMSSLSAGVCSAQYDDIEVTNCSGDTATLTVDNADNVATTRLTGKISTLLASDDLSAMQIITANGIAAQIQSVAYNNGSFQAEFAESLLPETQYEISMGDTVDILGRKIGKAVFTTRPFELICSVPKLYLDSGAERIELQSLRSGMLEGEVTVFNETEEDCDVTLIQALYNADGSLASAYAAAERIEAKGERTLITQMQVQMETGYSMKLFVWDNFTDRNTLNRRASFE